MIDPNLLNWVKKQLSSGISSDKIKEALSSKGWREEDINEVLNAASGKNLSAPRKNKSPVAIIFILSFIILAGIIASYFLLMPSNVPSTTINYNPVENNTSPPLINQNSIICSDIDCLISASNNCSAANFTSTNSVSLLGVNSTTTSYFELNNQSVGCALFQKILNESLVYTPEMVQQLISLGESQSQVYLQQTGINIAASVIIGKNGTCIFASQTNLTEYLTKIRDGNFSGEYSCNLSSEGNNCTSTGDWSLASNCSGDLFNEISLGYQYAP